VRGVSQTGAEGKQITLQGDRDLTELAIEAAGDTDTHRSLQFIDVTVGRDARVVLGDASAVKQAGLAAIAGFRVDFHFQNYKNSSPPVRAG
jgi:hypothetical protein